MNDTHFPPALSALPHWLCYRLERDDKNHRMAKVPYNPHNAHKASPTAPETWGTLAAALEAQEKYLFSGIGFVFTQKCGIIGIDIDHCLDENGQPNAVAAAILAKMPPTYIEISPSGTGLHIFVKGAMPPGGNKNTKTGVEMYANARYFTMTGNRHPACVDSIAAGDDFLAWVHENYVATKAAKPRKSKQYQGGGSTLADDKLLTAARSAKDGAAFDALWQGDVLYREKIPPFPWIL